MIEMNIHRNKIIEILAGFYLQKPSKQLLRLLKEFSLLFKEDLTADETFHQAIDSLHEDRLPEAIQFYYDLNFVPGQLLKKPYESVYIENSFNGKITSRIKDAYLAWNFNPKKIIHQELLLKENARWDHAGYELAFIAMVMTVVPYDPEMAAFISERRWLFNLGEDLISSNEPYHQLLGFVTIEIMKVFQQTIKA